MTNHILQLLAKFHQNLMNHSQVIRVNPFNPLNPLNLITYKDQFSSHSIQLTILCIVLEKLDEPKQQKSLLISC